MESEKAFVCFCQEDNLNKKLIYLLLVKGKCNWNEKETEKPHVKDVQVGNATAQQKSSLQ